MLRQEVETEESIKTQGSASLKLTVPNKRPCLKQGGMWGLSSGFQMTLHSPSHTCTYIKCTQACSHTYTCIKYTQACLHTLASNTHRLPHTHLHQIHTGLLTHIHLYQIHTGLLSHTYSCTYTCMYTACVCAFVYTHTQRHAHVHTLCVTFLAQNNLRVNNDHLQELQLLYLVVKD